MKNKERYAKEIIEVACSGNCFGIDNRTCEIVPCNYISCCHCVFKGEIDCDKTRIEWAEQEHIEKPVISKRYRKKPVVVEAIRFSSYAAEDIRNVLEFMGQTVNSYYVTQEKFSDYCFMCQQSGGVSIDTLEGEIKASIGDYIIRGVNGEYYPCKPDIFRKTYEPVEEE